MFVRVVSTPNSPRKSVRVVGSIREGYKVRQVILHYVGVATNDDELQQLKALGQKWIAQELVREKEANPQLNLLPPETSEEVLEKIEEASAANKGRRKKTTLQEISENDRVSLADLVEEKRVVEGIHDVAGHVYGQMDFASLLERSVDNEALKDLVLARIAQPSSKYSAQAFLEQHCSSSHHLDHLYRVMDKLLPKIDEVKQRTCSKTLQLTGGSIDVLFFDCTTLYFESTETDELRRFGYSKDHRFNTTQLVLALATDSRGLPIGYELFEGNKAEAKTLIECLRSWKKLFPIGQVCFVADRAMMSDANLEALEAEGLEYVIAAKLRSLPRSVKQAILDEKHYSLQSWGDEVGWVGEFEQDSRRLVVSYKSARAKRDQKQRQQIVDKLHSRLGASQGNTQKLISNQGVKKYTKTEASETSIDSLKIEQDAEWDGLHGVISNCQNASATELLTRYGRLWKIEESFRLNKHTLSMRPIFHFKPERIRAHIAICYMAFSVLRHMEYVVRLVQKISPQDLIKELMNVQSSYYKNMKTGKRYRLPGVFGHNASKIYKAFQLPRRNRAQEIIDS
jgi:transposase